MGTMTKLYRSSLTKEDEKRAALPVPQSALPTPAALAADIHASANPAPYSFSSVAVEPQAKLQIGSPDDPAEMEADRMADAAMAASLPATPTTADTRDAGVACEPYAALSVIRRFGSSPDDPENQTPASRDASGNWANFLGGAGMLAAGVLANSTPMPGPLDGIVPTADAGYPTQITAAAPAAHGTADAKSPYLTVPKGQMTFDAEGQEAAGPYFSRVLQHPGAESGVTVGRGYDLKGRKAKDIVKDLTDAGIDAATAVKIAEGAGLSGKDADDFLAKHTRDKDIGEITAAQQQALFQIAYDQKQEDVEGVVSRWAKKNDVADLPSLDDVDPVVRDVLVDLGYRGDWFPREDATLPDCRLRLKPFLKKGPLAAQELQDLKTVMSDTKLWQSFPDNWASKNVPQDRFDSRVKLVDEALQRVASTPPATPNGGSSAPPVLPKKIERAPSDGVDEMAGQAAPESVSRVLASQGTPLDAGARSFLEPRLGYDFSSVRVHSDPDAAASAASINARAYAVGADVVFGAGEYSPATSGGRWLLAHELTHVIQQGGAAPVEVQAKFKEETEQTQSQTEPESEAQTSHETDKEDECKDLLSEIWNVRNELLERIDELQRDPRHLQWNNWSKDSPAFQDGSKIGSVEGHKEQVVGKQNRLKKLLEEWGDRMPYDEDDCRRFKFRLPEDVWELAEAPVPVPEAQPEPNPNPWDAPGSEPSKPKGLNWEKIAAILMSVGLSLLLIPEVIAALADPEPATKLALLGLTAETAALLMSTAAPKRATVSAGGA